MVIGSPREIKANEYRVALTPEGVRELVSDGHRVLIEAGAGEGSGFSDPEYESAGARLVEREEVFSEAELIVKVKEPLREETDLLRAESTLFTFLHLAADRGLVDRLAESGVTALAYETLEDESEGHLPLLAPMSEIAGRMAPLMGAYHLQRFVGGSGVLAPGAVGVPRSRALVIGAGVVGSNALRVALGLGMEVTVINRGVRRLEELDRFYEGRIDTLASTRQGVTESLAAADVVIGAVLIPGSRAPRVVERGMLSVMRPGSVIVDVSVDQGGCVETTRPTTHEDPVYTVDGVIHYAVANMPGAYPRTATRALTVRTLPYIRKLAARGIGPALKEEAVFRSALNMRGGEIVHPAVASAFR